MYQVKMKMLCMAHQTASLGQYILNRRRAKNMSRTELAEKLTVNGYECTESAINHWENGRANPPIEDPAFARALALALDVPPSALIKASGALDITPELAEAVLARFSPVTLQLLKEASPQNIKKVEAVIRALLAEDEQ
jgi:transcriptional regulator with XRE-family HTH domain